MRAAGSPRTPRVAPVRYASAADRPAVEAALLAALRRGGPRLTPFRIAGEVDATWDGTTCAATVTGKGPGVYTVRYRGLSGAPSSVFIAGVRPPHAWSDLVDFLATVDLTTQTSPPDWFALGAQLSDDQGAGAPLTTTAPIEALTYGPVCASGTWPDLKFTAGEPFVVGG